MAHALRKYLSSRGSALFMVLSTMTALMIAAMAMYFSVISSRQVQYAVFYEEQSYQSAVSVTDAIIAGLNDGKMGDLGSKIGALSVGGTLSTEGNGYKSFTGKDSDKADNEDQIGAYDVNITRLEDSNDCQTYDFCVTASVNGVQEATHTLVMMKKSDGKYKSPTNLFTATGYTPNTNFLNNGMFLADVDIDSETVYFGVKGSPNVGPVFSSNVTCKGNAEIFGLGAVGSYIEKPRVWTFGGDLILHGDDLGNLHVAHDAFDMAAGKGSVDNPGIAYVGGDLRVEEHGKLTIQANNIVYVVGDLYTTQVEIKENAKLYVGGNIYVDTDYVKKTISDFTNNNSPIYGSGELYMGNPNKVIDRDFDGNDADENIDCVAEKWRDFVPHWEGGEPALTVKKWESADKTGIETTITSNIGLMSYPIWTIKDAKYTSEEDILFNSGWGDIRLDGAGDIVQPTATFESTKLKYSPTNTGCEINSIVDAALNRDNWATRPDSIPTVSNGWGKYTIIVDTGDKAENVFYLKLNANCVVETDSGQKKVFSWTPKAYKECDDNADVEFDIMMGGVNVLVRGKGSVVMEVPDGVVYQSNSNDFIGHESWFYLCGGTLKTDRTNALGDVIYEYSGLTGSTVASTAKKYIHKGCTHLNGGDGSDPYPCEIKTKTYKDPDDPTKNKTGPWCETHDCAVPAEKYANHECGCANHIGRKEIKADKPDIVDTYGYPTVNIWLVTKDANADLRFTSTLTKETAEGSSVTESTVDGSDGDKITTKVETSYYKKGALRIQKIVTTVTTVKSNGTVIADAPVTVETPVLDKVSKYIGGNIFMGYIYAPYMSFSGDAGPTQTTWGGVRLVGGLIVSDVKLHDWNEYIFCIPEKSYVDIGDLDDLENIGNVEDSGSWHIYGY